MFKSEKKAALCYATIQGRENLVAKFRNSWWAVSLALAQRFVLRMHAR
jgi:hypothetical protein